MKVVTQSVIYENPLPQLRSRQSAFPFLARRGDGVLLAAHQIGEAFESADGASYVSVSRDGGETWEAPRRMFPRSCGRPVSESCKITALADGRFIALGYAYFRDDPEKPIGNPETGGLLDDFVFWSESGDGIEWGPMCPIPSAWGPHTEASAPLTVLKSGAWITPVTGFPKWDGTMTGPMCGRALRSDDGGRTWNDDAVCMAFPSGTVTCYEQRMCELGSGTLVCIGWNEDTKTGERLENHYTVSRDGGATWSAPVPTGVRGQASSVCALGGERLLALHAVRRDTDRPGIYGYVVDLSGGRWEILDSALLWEPAMPPVRDPRMAAIFSFLKFGQPGAVVLPDGDALMSFWYAQDGQYRTRAARIRF